MRVRLNRTLLACGVILAALTSGPRADVNPAQPLPFFQDWTNTSQITVDDNWSGVPGITGYRGDGLASATGVNPQTILGEGAPVVDVNANLTNPNTFITGGVAEFELTNPVVALQGSGTAQAPNLVISVNTTAWTDIHVSYNLRDIDGSADNAVQPVALQYRVGTSGNFTNVPAGFVADASTGPNLATLVTPVSVTLPADANNQPVLQIRIITTNAVGNDEWIGVDDISIAGTGGGSTSPSGILSASTSTYSAGDPISLSVAVTPGTIPPSTGLTVTGNLTAIGLGTPTFTDQGNGTFTFNGTVPGGLSGAKSITATISDSNTPPRSSTTAPITVTIQSALAPTAIGSATPASVSAGGSTLLSVTVTPGTNPASSGLVVTGDLSSIIPGDTAQPFQAGPNNTFTFTAAVDAATVPGTKQLPITVVDDQVRSFNFNLPVTVTAPLANSTIVISQVYGGGGNSNATYLNDFVQLYNRGNTTVDLSGWTLQYASAAGTSWTNKQPLGGPLAAGQYYLVALASGGAVGAALPPPNISGQINISATTGKIALVDNGDTLSGPCPLSSTHVRDFVGYGTTATCREGTTNAPAPSNTTAIFRQGGGFIDTNDNFNDFVVGPPAPTTTAPIVEIGPAVLTTDPLPGASTAPRDATLDVTFTEPVDVFGAWYDIACSATGSHDDATTAVSNNFKDHYITPNANFLAGETCTVRIFQNQISDQDTDDSAPNTDHLPADYVWSFTVATGAAPPYTPDVHLTMGNPSGAVADVNQPNNYLMMKPEYAVSYNRALGRPNWVSWHLTPEWFGTLTRVDTFRADPQVPPDWYRVQSFDFENSGFDRGHMTPNADRDLETSIPINQATYLMSNMLAQAPDNNQGPWANLENHLRDLVGSDRANPLAEAYIVSGPAGAGGSGSNGGTTVTLANGNVTVAAYTWKVALIIPYGTNDVARVACDTAHTIAVIMPNTQGIRTSNADDWRTYLTTVDAVETLTGYDFFSNVPPAIQNCIQAGVDGDNPQSQTITFAPIAAHHYGDPDFTVSATASSNLPVTFSVVSGPATVVGGVVHLTGAGAVTIRAAQPGTPNPQPPLKNTFAKAPPVDQTFTVAKGTPLFSSLSSPTTEAGSSTTVEGVLGAGGLVPSGSVEITAGTLNVTAPIDANGHFTATLATGSFTPASSPFAIGFSYAGDANFSGATATSTLTVADTIPPVVTLIGPAVLTLEAGKAFVDPGATAQDSFAGNLTAAIHASGAVDTSLVGTYTRTYTVSDGYNTGSATRTVKVIDTTAPSIADVTATPDLVTVPNHKMFDVFIAYNTSDVSGGPVCSLEVISNEPINGTGDGNTAVDWLVVDAHHVQVRAERAGTGSGRIYTIVVSCTDAFGNTASKQTTVTVPK